MLVESLVELLGRVLHLLGSPRVLHGLLLLGVEHLLLLLLDQGLLLSICLLLLLEICLLL